MKIKSLIILSFTLVCLLMLNSCKENEEDTQANDYAPFSVDGFVFRWQQNSTITIVIPDASTNANITGSSLSTTTSFNAASDGGDDADETALIAGINQWSDLLSDLGITLNIQQNSTAASDIRVFWNDGTGVSTGVLGFASFDSTTDPSRYFVITTLANYAGFREHTATEIQFIAAHEFGHIFGFWSHSFDSEDVMFPSISLEDFDLTNRDLETMRHLYSLNADVDFSSFAQNSLNSSLGKIGHFNSNTDGSLMMISCGLDENGTPYQPISIHH